MSLVLNEEQVFLKDSAKKFASEKTPTSHFREVRDSEIDNCYDDKIWHAKFYRHSSYQFHYPLLHESEK